MTGSISDTEQKRSSRRQLGSIKAQRMAETRLLSPGNKYIARCGQNLRLGGELGNRVEFEVSPCGTARKTGSYYHCGSMSCYDCSLNSRIIVSSKILEAMRNWVDPAIGRHVVFVGFSIPHRQGDNLPQLIEILDDGVRYACRDSDGTKTLKFKAKWGIKGRVMADDWTFGRYGHHPHVAGIFLVDWGDRDVGLTLLGFRADLLSAFCGQTKIGFASQELGDKWAYRADVDGVPALFATRDFARQACKDQGQGYESIEPVRLGSRKVLYEAQYVDMPYGRWTVGPDSVDSAKEAIRISHDRSPTWGMRGDFNLANLAKYLCKASTEVTAPHTGIGGGLTPTDLLDIRAHQLGAESKMNMLCSTPNTSPVMKNFHIPMGPYDLSRVIWHQYRRGYAKRRVVRTSKRFFEVFGVDQRVPCESCHSAHAWAFDRTKPPQEQIYCPWVANECTKCKNRGWRVKETYRPMKDLIHDVSVDEDNPKPKIDWDSAKRALDVEPSVSKGIEDARLMGWLLWYLSRDRPGRAELVAILSSVDHYEVRTKWYRQGTGKHARDIAAAAGWKVEPTTSGYWERKMVWSLLEDWVELTGLESPSRWALAEEQDWGGVEVEEVAAEPYVSTWWRDEGRLQLDLCAGTITTAEWVDDFIEGFFPKGRLGASEIEDMELEWALIAFELSW